MTRTTTCGGCARKFSFDDSLFAPSPPSTGFFGSYLCPDCAAQRNEDRRHEERMRADRLRMEVDEQRHSELVAREREEARRLEDARGESDREHRDLLETERRWQEEQTRLLAEESEARARDEICREVEAEARRDADARSALDAAKDFTSAGLFEDALRSIVRAQQVGGFEYKVAEAKLGLALKWKKPELLTSISTSIEALLEGLEATPTNQPVFEPWVELLRRIDRPRAEQCKKSFFSRLQARAALQDLAQAEAERERTKQAEAAAEAEKQKKWKALEEAAEEKANRARSDVTIAAFGLIGLLLIGGLGVGVIYASRSTPPQTEPTIGGASSPLIDSSPQVVAAAPPPMPPPAPPAPSRIDIAGICPTQVKPELPRKALQYGISGVVRAQVRIGGGVVKEVIILSGPQVYHQAVRAAMSQYRCVSSGDEVIAVQEFVFKVE